MEIISNFSLKALNTFGIESFAKLFVKVNSVEQINELLDSTNFKNNHHLILGGGSNLLLTKNVDGLVIKNELQGIEVVNENDSSVFVKCAAGVIWHELVLCVLIKIMVVLKI